MFTRHERESHRREFDDGAVGFAAASRQEDVIGRRAPRYSEERVLDWLFCT